DRIATVSLALRGGSVPAGLDTDPPDARFRPNSREWTGSRARAACGGFRGGRSAAHGHRLSDGGDADRDRTSRPCRSQRLDADLLCPGAVYDRAGPGVVLWRAGPQEKRTQCDDAVRVSDGFDD